MVETDSSPTRVAFCVTELDPGGAERALLQIVTRLDRDAWLPIVIALGPETRLADELRSHGITVHCLGARGPLSLGVVFKLIRILREFRPTILQTWLFHANILGRLAAWVARVPIVLSGVRVAEGSARWHTWLERLTRGLVSHHVCVSHDVSQFVVARHHVRPQNVSVVPNGVDWERFAHAEPADLSRFGIPAGSRTILGVGRLHPQKGWLDLLEAVEPLLRNAPDLHVLILGEGPQREELESTIARKDLAGQIHLPGWEADVAGIMRASTMLVLASHWEGMPNVVLEALASGLPLVATEVTGVAETLPESVRANLIKPNSPLELRAAMERSLSHSEASSQTARELQLHVQQWFTWENTARKWAEVANSQLRQ